MEGSAERKAVSGRRAKAARRTGKLNSGRNAAQPAQKLRSKGSPGSLAQTGSRPGLKRKSRLAVKEVDDPTKAQER